MNDKLGKGTTFFSVDDRLLLWKQRGLNTEEPVLIRTVFEKQTGSRIFSINKTKPPPVVTTRVVRLDEEDRFSKRGFKSRFCAVLQNVVEGRMGRIEPGFRELNFCQ